MDQTPKTRPKTVPDPEVLLEEIGGFKTTIPIDPVPPSEDPGENEVWIRRRAVLTRVFYENYPEHEKALSCLVEYWLLQGMQPDLFLNVQDDSCDAAIDTTGGYRNYDFRDESVLESWRQAYRSISVLKTAQARRILEQYPDLPIANWAHSEIVSDLFMDIHDFDPEHGSTAELQRVTAELLISTKNFLEYRANIDEPTRFERAPGHWEFDSLKAAEHLMFAAEALACMGRETQFRYLSEAETLFPDNEFLRNLRKKLEAENQRFSLSFKDLSTGKLIDIGDYRGDVVLIDFWATWCKPCLDSIPYLRRLLKRQSNRGLKIVGISSDVATTVIDGQLYSTRSPSPQEQSELEADVLRCAERYGIDWPLFIDDEFHRKWGVKSIPTIFAIDRKGILRSTNARESLEQLVEELLSE